MTAADWVFGLRRGLDPATLSVYSGILYPLKNAVAVNRGELEPERLGVRAIDDLTLEITLENPNAVFSGFVESQYGLSGAPAQRGEKWRTLCAPGQPR